MKRRLLVMNGQRLVQSEQRGLWNTDKVEKAGAMKPGIYNIHLSVQAEKNKTHNGVIVYADTEHVYQQVGRGFVKHDRLDFDKVPDFGSNSSVSYDEGKAVVTASAINLGRKIS
jgi:hypothetical protein